MLNKRTVTPPSSHPQKAKKTSCTRRLLRLVVGYCHLPAQVGGASPQSLVCWLAFLCPVCVPLCKILYHTAGRCPAADQTKRKPNHTRPEQTGADCSMSSFAVFAFTTRNLPLTPFSKKKEHTQKNRNEATKWSCLPYSVLPFCRTPSTRSHSQSAVPLSASIGSTLLLFVNLTASGHTALLFNSNNNFWFVSLHF